MVKKSRIVLVFVLALIFAASTYAFAAANSMPTGSSAGDGSATISGYTVSGVTYTLDSTDPSKIKTVTFTVTPAVGGSAATTAEIQLVSAGTWYSCTLASNVATCNVGGGVTALNATTLRVVAAQ